MSNSRTKSSILRNEEIMKSLAALKEELSEEGHNNNNDTCHNTDNYTYNKSHSTDNYNNNKSHSSDNTDISNPLVPSNIPQNSSKARNDSAILRMKAETAAEMYLGMDDAGKFLRFLDFYVSLYECGVPSFKAKDPKIVKVFDLFAGDVKKSTDFLIISEELEELGFDEDKVLSALMLNSNDREAALDFLMKN